LAHALKLVDVELSHTKNCCDVTAFSYLAIPIER
jgi:hypothetical protein